MASTDSRPIPIKNTAYRGYFPIYDADGDLVTGAASLDSEVSKDGGAYADCTNEATEIGSSGSYFIDMTSTEMNADNVSVIVKTATAGAKSTFLTWYPQESGDIKVEVQSVVAGAIAAAAFAANALDAVWSTATRAVTDKAGFALSSAGVQAIWDAATSALTTAGSIGKWLLDKLDVVLSTRLATSGYTAPPTAGAVADQIWDEALAGHVGAGSTGEALGAAGGAGDPWITAIPGAYGAGSAGKILGDNLNATVSSRSSHSAADVWAAGTRTLTSFGALVADVATAVWAAATRILTAATNITSTGGTTVPQTGDAFARLGAPAGASHAADVAAVKVDTAAILVDTGTTLDGRIPAALTGAGNMKSDALAINGSTTAADKLKSHAAGVLQVVIGAGSTTTAVVLNATTGIDGGVPSAVDDFYNGRVIVFTSGALAGQATDITNYVGGTVTLTVTALTGAPASGVTAVIV